MVGIVHARRDQVKEAHRITLFLAMRGVGRIKGPERAVARADVTFNVKSTGGCGQGGEAMIPPSSRQLGRNVSTQMARVVIWLVCGPKASAELRRRRFFA